jgi:hypothetical protein
MRHETEPYDNTPLPDARDEAYSEACAEIDRLRTLLKRAADALETYPTLGRPRVAKLLSELRKENR